MDSRVAGLPAYNGRRREKSIRFGWIAMRQSLSLFAALTTGYRGADEFFSCPFPISTPKPENIAQKWRRPR
jgi:hypothetical protein